MKEPVEIQFRRQHQDVVIPSKATEASAGFDIVSDGVVADYANKTILVHTGLYTAFPNNYVLKIYGRSGLSWKGIRLINGVGIIDADYRGDILLKFKVDETITLMPKACDLLQIGNRVAQCILEELPQTTWREVLDLDETIRGTGGFGSTGA